MIKIFHTSDLHLGKKLLGVSRVDEQRLFLEAFILDIKENKPDIIVISGDIFDRAIPPEDAVSIFGAFLETLASLDIIVILISGNHDSAKRLGLYSGMLTKLKLYVCTDFKQSLAPLELIVNGQKLNVYAVPYTDPAIVSYQMDNPDIKTHDDVFKYLSAHWSIDKSEKNILLAHGYFGAGYQTSDSEKPLSIGGTDIVRVDYLKAFDYCALGHLHKSQKIADSAYYSGSPLKYSFSEHRDKKRYLVVLIDDAISVQPKFIFQPIEVTQLKGNFDDLLVAEKANKDYLSIHLTDQLQIHDPLARLRFKYPNLLKLTFDYHEKEATEILMTDIETKDIRQHFEDFYSQLYSDPMTDELKTVLMDVLAAVIKDTNE